MRIALEVRSKIDEKECEIEALRDTRSKYNSDLVDCEIHERLEVIKVLKWVLDGDED